MIKSGPKKPALFCCLKQRPIDRTFALVGLARTTQDLLVFSHG